MTEVAGKGSNECMKDSASPIYTDESGAASAADDYKDDIDDDGVGRHASECGGHNK